MGKGRTLKLNLEEMPLQVREVISRLDEWYPPPSPVRKLILSLIFLAGAKAIGEELPSVLFLVERALKTGKVPQDLRTFFERKGLLVSGEEVEELLNELLEERKKRQKRGKENAKKGIRFEVEEKEPTGQVEVRREKIEGVVGIDELPEEEDDNGV